MTGRVAIVTGGTRGIGRAICVGLRDAGCRVTANYSGDDDAAKDFTQDTGIKVFKWDAGSYDACQHGVAEVIRELGPAEVLINNADTTRDSTMHKMTH